MGTEEMSLVMLTGLAQQIEKSLIESGGEITPEIEKMLSVVDAELPKKVDSYDFLMQKFDKECELWRERADKLYALSNAFLKAKETLKERILFAMQNSGATEVLGDSVRFKLVATPPALQIVDESKIPEGYFETVIEKKLKKAQLKNDLKEGIPVSGAALTQGQSVRVFANKGKS